MEVDMEEDRVGVQGMNLRAIAWRQAVAAEMVDAVTLFEGRLMNQMEAIVLF